MHLEDLSMKTFQRCKDKFEYYTHPNQLEASKMTLTGLVYKYAKTDSVSFPKSLLKNPKLINVID